MNLQEFLDDIDLHDGDTLRTYCPVCAGKGTFTVSRVDNALLYNCYKNSCGIRGRVSKGRSVSGIRKRISTPYEAPVPALQLDKTALTVPLHNVSCNAYLDEMNTRKSIEDGYTSVLYDIAEHRCVFMIYDDSRNLIGAVGRALTKGAMPKWKRYDKRKDLLFFCGPKEGTAVLVEDCASACTLYAAGLTGVALLGTNLSDSQVIQLRCFSKVIVALDADASRKALKLQKMLAPYVDAEVKFLADDLKYYSPDTVRHLFTS